MVNVLKNATKQLIKNVGGLDEAAKLCRLGKSQLANTYDPNKPAIYMPIDVVMDLEASVDMPCVTKCLADFKRLAFITVDSGHGGGRIEYDILQLTRSFSGLMEAYQEGLANDGMIDKMEAKGLLDEATDLQGSIIHLKERLAKILEEPI